MRPTNLPCVIDKPHGSHSWQGGDNYSYQCYGVPGEPQIEIVPTDKLDQLVQTAQWVKLIEMADRFDVVRAEWREDDGRTLRSSALGYAIAELRAEAKKIAGGE